MRIITSQEITRAVYEAALQANTVLPGDIKQALEQAYEDENDTRARTILKMLLQNAELASKEGLALCQDTGLAVVDITLGQDIHIKGDLQEAVNKGISEGYREGGFRASVVEHPFFRKNTGDNTPCILHTHLVSGEGFSLTVFPKGAGSENMGRLGMLKPGAGVEGMKDFVLDTVKTAGSNPCPPLVIGVGIGGNMETAAYLAKKALMRPIRQAGPNSELEQQLLNTINETGIGPQGLGGKTTALGVNIEVYPTHIASLPVAINLGCHSTRRYTINL
ncbi:MAG: fumarate hydratase [Chitinophagales bacterium]